MPLLDGSMHQEEDGHCSYQSPKELSSVSLKKEKAVSMSTLERMARVELKQNRILPNTNGIARRIKLATDDYLTRDIVSSAGSGMEATSGGTPSLPL